MPSWEVTQQSLTLLIAQNTTGNKTQYKLYPWYKRNVPDLGTFMAPLSWMMGENTVLTFDRIEYVYCPRMPDNRDGDTALTGTDYYAQLSQFAIG